MIRQDYLVRMAQRLAQALAQALFHKRAHDYERAEAEINAALAECFGLDHGASPDFDSLLRACATETTNSLDTQVRLAELLRERGEIQRLRGNAPAAGDSEALALGLFLEILRSSIVSLDLIEKTEQLIERTAGTRLPAPVLKRLLSYYEARGRFDLAEDVLYEWMATRDPDASEGGLVFYNRIAAKPDEELNAGGLPRAELEQGRAEWLRLNPPAKSAP